MKDLVAGMCAGVVVGVVGLAAGLTLVPVRDHEAMRGGDSPAAAPVSTPPSIFADDAEPDRAVPVDREQDESIFAEAEPTEPTAETVEGMARKAEPVLREPDVQAAAVTDTSVAAEERAAGAAAEVSPLPDRGPEVAVAVKPAAKMNGEPAARLRPADQDGASATAIEQERPLDGGEAAVAPPPPPPQVIAPRALAAISFQMDEPNIRADAATDRLREEAGTTPPVPETPEAELAPPTFDGVARTPPQPLAESAPSQVGDEAPVPEEAEDDLPALIRNAVAEPPFGNLPLLAVVLVDRAGTDPIPGVPLSVAIAADSADAGGRAEAWRAAGAEIVAILGSPAEGTRSLASFDATFQALPQAATVMAETGRGFAGGPIAFDEIAATIAETGHGLILRSGTSEPVARAAERAGVPTVNVFRRVDGSGRDGRAVARFLDQAAFEARNRGAVVVIADNSPETAEGLERFLAGSRADTVALVPVSAILRSR